MAFVRELEPREPTVGSWHLHVVLRELRVVVGDEDGVPFVQLDLDAECARVTAVHLERTRVRDRDDHGLRVRRR